MGKRPKSIHSLEKKLKLLREHIQQKVPVSEICEKHGIRPSVYYAWQKNLLESGSLDGPRRTEKESSELKKAKRRIAQLEAKLQYKDTIMAELLEEHVGLKKSINGEN